MSVTIMVPVELPDEFFKKVQEAMVDSMKEIAELYVRAHDLPEYPTAAELKRTLKIGDVKVNQWIEGGLPIIPWSKKENRFDREDIKAHIQKMKI
ncbi:hypothetical protein ACYSNR_03105 [Enterococcus sp. LJL128]